MIPREPTVGSKRGEMIAALSSVIAETTNGIAKIASSENTITCAFIRGSVSDMSITLFVILSRIDFNGFLTRIICNVIVSI